MITIDSSHQLYSTIDELVWSDWVRYINTMPIDVAMTFVEFCKDKYGIYTTKNSSAYTFATVYAYTFDRDEDITLLLLRWV